MNYPQLIWFTNSVLFDFFAIFVYEAMSFDTLIYKLPDLGMIDALMEIYNINHGLPPAFTRDILASAKPGQNSESSLRIFPNPAKDYIIVYFKLDDPLNNALLAIYSMEGKGLFSIPINGNENQVVIPTGSLKNGIYLVKLIGSKDNPANARFIITR